jgi:hypothetical protein
LTLDLAIGETSAIEREGNGKIQDIAQKVKDLNGRLQDIRREQVFQRVSAVFPGTPFKILWIGKGVQFWWMNLKADANELMYRSERPSSEISPSLRMLELCDGL